MQDFDLDVIITIIPDINKVLDDALLPFLRIPVYVELDGNWNLAIGDWVIEFEDSSVKLNVSNKYYYERIIGDRTIVILEVLDNEDFKYVMVDKDRHTRYEWSEAMLNEIITYTGDE